MAAAHFIRKKAEEISHPHRRLQDISRGKAHAADRLINRFDHSRAGVMSVQRAGPCHFILLLRQKAFQLLIFPRPACFFRIKGIGQSTPAHILSKDRLFFRRSIPVFLFQCEKSADSLYIALVFCLRAAFPQMLVCNPIVLGRNLCRTCKGNFIL